MVRTTDRVVVTVNSIHMPSRTISINQAVVTVNSLPMASSQQAMEDNNSSQDMDSKVDMISSQGLTDNPKLRLVDNREASVNSKLEVLLDRKRRRTLAATTQTSRATTHMVR
jgi:hypothetical protein